MIQTARQQTASPARKPEAASRPSPAPAPGRGALPAALSGAGGPPSRWSLGAPNDAAEREAETAAGRIERGLPAGPMSAAGGDGTVRGDGATAGAGPLPQPAAQALNGLSSGGGRPLSAPQMTFFGEAFSGPGRSPDAVRTSLEPVRVHTDARAATVLEHTGAAAANVGAHVISRPTDYAPDRPDGGPHFPHEIAHALQPGGQAGDGVVRRILKQRTNAQVRTAPKQKAGVSATNQAKIDILFAALVNSQVTYAFDNTPSEIYGYITDFIQQGGLETDLDGFAQDSGAEVEDPSDLYGRSNRLNQTKGHKSNFAAFTSLQLEVAKAAAGEIQSTSVKAQLLSYITQKAPALNLTAANADKGLSPADFVTLSADLQQLRDTIEAQRRLAGLPSQRVDISVPQFGAIGHQGMGSSATLRATPYSALPKGSGSQKSKTRAAAWEPFLNCRRTGTAPLYVRGHLLNANLSGPELGINLVPLTYRVLPVVGSGNERHSTTIEDPLKAEVQGMLGDRSVLADPQRSLIADQHPSEVVYKVEANYAATPDDGRRKLLRQAVRALISMGRDAARARAAAIQAATTAKTAVPPPLDVSDGAVISAALANDPSLAALAFSATADVAKSRAALGNPATNAELYDLALENAGLWQYDYQYVPRSLNITTTRKTYQITASSAPTEVAADPQIETVPNELNAQYFERYRYVRDGAVSAQLRQRGLYILKKLTTPAPAQTAASPPSGQTAVASATSSPPVPTTSLSSSPPPPPPPQQQQQTASGSPGVPGLSSLSSAHTPTSPSPIRLVPATSFSSPKPPQQQLQQTQQTQQRASSLSGAPSLLSLSSAHTPASPTPVRLGSATSPQPPQSQSQSRQPPGGALAGQGFGLTGYGAPPLRYNQMDAAGNAITSQYYTQSYTQRPPNSGGGSSTSVTRAVSSPVKPQPIYSASPSPGLSTLSAPSGPVNGGSTQSQFNSSAPPPPSPIPSQTQSSPTTWTPPVSAFTPGQSLAGGSTPSALATPLNPYGVYVDPTLQIQAMLASYQAQQLYQQYTQSQQPQQSPSYPPYQAYQPQPSAAPTPTPVQPGQWAQYPSTTGSLPPIHQLTSPLPVGAPSPGSVGSPTDSAAATALALSQQSTSSSPRRRLQPPPQLQPVRLASTTSTAPAPTIAAAALNHGPQPDADPPAQDDKKRDREVDLAALAQAWALDDFNKRNINPYTNAALFRARCRQFLEALQREADDLDNTKNSKRSRTGAGPRDAPPDPPNGGSPGSGTGGGTGAVSGFRTGGF